MRLIRWILGSLILFLDWVFTPKGIKRSPEEQDKIDQKTTKLALYQYAACPFCVKVRRAMKRNTLNISTFDAKRSDESRKQLLDGGGKLKVPCLRIEREDGSKHWMYESSDIIAFLESGLNKQNFSI